MTVARVEIRDVAAAGVTAAGPLLLPAMSSVIHGCLRTTRVRDPKPDPAPRPEPRPETA